MTKSIFLIMLIFIMAGCSDKPKYEIKDAGMNALEGSIHWMDNETLIFVNWDYRHIKSIYTWNTVTNKLKLHRENIDSNICYSDGYITYRSRDEDGKIFHRSGIFPNEEEYSADQIDKKSKFNRYSCKRFIPPEEHQDKNIHYLKEDHGYIEIGLKGEDVYEYPVYVSPKGDRISINHRYDWYYNRPKDYYKFKDGYFLFKPFLPVWDGSGCNPGIWIYPEGKVESVCIPFLSAVRNYGDSFPVFNGYLIVSYQAKSNTEVGESGIYYFKPKTSNINLLYPGINKNISISTDGCKIAFIHNPVFEKHITLKTINLCKQVGSD